MVYKDFSNMAVDHFGHLPFVWRFKDRYLMMAGNWFVTLNMKCLEKKSFKIVICNMMKLPFGEISTICLTPYTKS